MVYSGVRSGNLLENFDFGEPGAPVSMLELATDAERDEMRMFESVIEMDFLEAASRRAFTETNTDHIGDEDDDDESGASPAAKEAKEEATKSIFEKIKAAIKKAIAFIKQFIANFIAKIKNFIANDRKLVHDNEKYFTKQYLAGFKVTDYKEIMDEDQIGDKFSFEKCCDGLNADYTNKDDIPDQKKINKKIAENFGLSGEDKVNSVAITQMLDKARTKHDGETELVNINGEIERILGYMKNGKTVIDRAKRQGKLGIAELQYAEKDLKFAKGHTEGDLEIAIANYKYGLVKAQIQALSIVLSSATSFMSRNLADARTTFVKACKYAKGKYDGNKDQKANQESAELLGLASELYCESALELI